MAEACLTLAIEPNRFKITIALSLTTMLVMQTLHDNISAELPQDSDIKFVDHWLCFGTLLPFIVFVKVVFIELLPDESPLELQMKANVKKRRMTKQRVHGACKIIVPTVTALIVLGFTFTAICLSTMSGK